MAEETNQNTSWHDTFSPEDKGFLEIKGWHKLPDVNAAMGAALASYREAEKKLGAPADRMVRWPDANDADGMKALHVRLGVPADAAGYDFSTVKFTDGTPIEKDFETFMRDTALKHNLPKDVAPAVAAAILKFGEDAEKAEQANATVSRQAEDVKLRADWLGNYDVFKATVDRFLQTVPFTPEQKDAFTSSAAGMKLLYAVASANAEDRGHGIRDGGVPGGSNRNMSREEAAQTLEQRKQDPTWLKRYREGDKAAIDEFMNLTTLMVGPPPRR